MSTTGRSTRGDLKKHIALAALISLSPVFVSVSTTAQKMKPDELVAKHVQSIGSAEARAAARNRIITGTSVLHLRVGGTGQAIGSALLASDARKNMLILAFGSPDYPFEKAGFDGSKLTVRHVRPGLRSPLGEFFRSHEVMFKEGLIGGSLSEAWPLLRLSERDAKIEYGGLKKVGDRQVHELKYIPRKGSDLKIKLFFDAENFRHVRTEYERVVAAAMGATPQTSVSERETRIKVVEDFADFKEEGGLTLPHTYKFELTIQSQRTPFLIDWVLELKNFNYNQTMTDKEFDVESE